MGDIKNFINGEYVTSKGGKTFGARRSTTRWSAWCTGRQTRVDAAVAAARQRSPAVGQDFRSMTA
jgi:hypothetical protein